MLRQQNRSIETLHKRIDKTNTTVEGVDAKLDQHLIAASAEAKDLENVKETTKRIEARVFNGD